MILYLFTDFGYQGPYIGELRAVFARANIQDCSVVDLMHDAPAFDPLAAACMLAALCRNFQSGDACLAVVDPGVGNESRRPILVKADGVLYAGPDNGLLAPIVRHAHDVEVSEILWRPQRMSNSFHGRDLFAPALQMKLNGQSLALKAIEGEKLVGVDWPDDLQQVIYIDTFGNLITGLRGHVVNREQHIMLAEQQINYAETFSATHSGQPFWYVNSMGLVEIAVNQGSAADYFGVKPGEKISILG